MALTKSFYEAVSEGNVLRIRIMMKDSLLVDPTFRDFDEMEKEAASIKGLYDEHDGSAFNTNKETWNDEYMNILMVEVVENFSHERIEHLKDVVRYLRPVKENTKTTQSSNNIKYSSNKNENNLKNKQKISYQEQKRHDQRNGSYRGVKIGIGVVVGATIGGVVASAAEVTVFGGMAIGAVTVGVAVTIATSKRD